MENVYLVIGYRAVMLKEEDLVKKKNMLSCILSSQNRAWQ